MNRELIETRKTIVENKRKRDQMEETKSWALNLIDSVNQVIDYIRSTGKIEEEDSIHIEEIEVLGLQDARVDSPAHNNSFILEKSQSRSGSQDNIPISPRKSSLRNKRKGFQGTILSVYKLNSKFL